MEYRVATLDDIDLLTASRVKVLRAANKLDDSVDMTEVEKESYNYYKKALADGTHFAILVMADGDFIGAGGVSFYNVMPTYHNPSGKKAYLDMLVNVSKERGVKQISLEATDMGRPLYEKYGFIKMESEMELI